MIRDELLARAKERAETPPTPPEWGYRLVLEEGDSFVGRWRGETVDEQNDDRRIFLLWDEDGEPCFSRSYAALVREVDRALPELGCTIVIVRGKDYTSASGTGFSFGIEAEPSDDPLPDADMDVPAVESDGIPF